MQAPMWKRRGGDGADAVTHVERAVADPVVVVEQRDDHQELERVRLGAGAGEREVAQGVAHRGHRLTISTTTAVGAASISDRLSRQSPPPPLLPPERYSPVSTL